MKVSSKPMAIGVAVLAIILVVVGVVWYNSYQNAQALEKQLNAISEVSETVKPDTPVSEKVAAYAKLVENWSAFKTEEIKPEAQAKYDETLKALKDEIYQDFTKQLKELENIDIAKIQDIAIVKDNAAKLEAKLKELKAAAEAFKDMSFGVAETEKYSALAKTYQERVMVLEEEAKRKAEEEARKKAEEEARKKAEAEAKIRQKAYDDAIAESLRDPNGSLAKVMARDWPMITFENDYFTFGPVPLGWAYLKRLENMKNENGQSLEVWEYGIKHPADSQCMAHGNTVVVVPPGVELPLYSGRKAVFTTSSGYTGHSLVTGYGIPPCDLWKAWKIEVSPK